MLDRWTQVTRSPDTIAVKPLTPPVQVMRLLARIGQTLGDREHGPRTAEMERVRKMIRDLKVDAKALVERG